jgi:hypothetical protein
MFTSYIKKSSNLHAEVSTKSPLTESDAQFGFALPHIHRVCQAVLIVLPMKTPQSQNLVDPFGMTAVVFLMMGAAHNGWRSHAARISRLAQVRALTCL